MRREVMPARLSDGVLMFIAIAMMIAGCSIFVAKQVSDNTIEEPVSLSPVHEPIPLLWPEYFEGGLDGHAWFVPSVLCLGYSAMVFQWPGWACERLQ